MNGGASRSRGAGLVEIMIGLALSLLVMAAISDVYVSARHSTSTQESVTRRQENQRFATALLEREIRMAGYRGCLNSGGTFSNTLGTPTAFLFQFDQPVQGNDAQTSGWAPALDSSIPVPLAGTDVLTLRTITASEAYLTQDMSLTSSDLKIAAGMPAAVTVGDVLSVSDCGGTGVFQVTAYNASNGTIAHAAGSGSGFPSPGNSTNNLGRRYPSGSMVYRVATVSYFIANNGSNNPALWRRVGTQTPEVLVDGIENMQLQFGEDTNADTVPDAYRTSGAVANWRNVVSVRLALLATSIDTPLAELDPRSFSLLDRQVGPFSDRRLRRVTTATYAVRNRLP